MSTPWQYANELGETYAGGGRGGGGCSCRCEACTGAPSVLGFINVIMTVGRLTALILCQGGLSASASTSVPGSDQQLSARTRTWTRTSFGQLCAHSQQELAALPDMSNRSVTSPSSCSKIFLSDPAPAPRRTPTTRPECSA